MFVSKMPQICSSTFVMCALDKYELDYVRKLEKNPGKVISVIAHEKTTRKTSLYGPN